MPEPGDIIETYIPELGRKGEALVVKIIIGPRGGKKVLLRPLGRVFTTSLSSIRKE